MGHMEGEGIRQPQNHGKRTNKKQKEPISRFLSNGGRWWIRTTEARSNRFTVCPLWPLGKSPISNCHGDKDVELVDGLEPPTC